MTYFHWGDRVTVENNQPQTRGRQEHDETRGQQDFPPAILFNQKHGKCRNYQLFNKRAGFSNSCVGRHIILSLRSVILVTWSPTTRIVRMSRAWRSIPLRCNASSSWTRGRSWNHRRRTQPSRRKHISGAFFYRTCHRQRTDKCLSSTRVWPENYTTKLYIGTYIILL